MKKFLVSILIFGLILAGTIVVVLYGKGYRFGVDKGVPQLAGTGLFVATSKPDGAQVFINGNLTTATNNTINLTPGIYQVKIVKQGYFAWEKQVKIKKETVAKEEAFLIPTAPKLESITDTGVLNPTIDPAKTRIAYIVASSSAKDNGIFILDINSRPILTLQGNSKQIADDTVDKFSAAAISWSPDGNQILATVSARPTYLLSANDSNNSPRNVTEILFSVDADWQTQKLKKETSRLNGLKQQLRKVITDNFQIMEWAPDESKILYTASASATIPTIIKPALIGTNSTREERNIIKDNLYVYDIKEDRNYKIDGKMPAIDSTSISWFPDSRHFIYVHDKRIDILEYDGLNETTVYAGPFIGSYAFPWPDGSRIAMLTNLNNPNITPNLYTISLR